MITWLDATECDLLSEMHYQASFQFPMWSIQWIQTSSCGFTHEFVSYMHNSMEKWMYWFDLSELQSTDAAVVSE